MSRQVVVVTGGSRGIGAATARAAAEAGWDVCVNYASNRSAAEAVAAEVEAAGGRATCFAADVADEAHVKALFAHVDAEFGRLDGLVNNAGVTGPMGSLEDLEIETLDRVLAVNVRGTFMASREAVLRMSTRRGGYGGGIVNLSSRAAAFGGAGEWLHYGASKGAVESFTLGLSREVGRQGIRVNCVSPGLIDTEIHEAAGGGDRLAHLAGNVPLGRVGTADEVAATIVWLLSSAAPYVTGASIPISGGR